MKLDDSASRQLMALYSQSLDCLEGKGVPQDASKAFSLNAQSAAGGYGDAVLAMGWFYLRGVGVERNFAEAERWYRASARQGDTRAMFSLGQIATIQRDYSGAQKWFSRASAKGHHRSWYWLGRLHWRGHGVALDRKEARRLFQVAAGHKVVEAQRALRFLSRRRAA